MVNVYVPWYSSTMVNVYVPWYSTGGTMVHVYCTKWQYHWYAMPAACVLYHLVPGTMVLEYQWYGNTIAGRGEHYLLKFQIHGC